MTKVRYVMLGGFLGAGKTTALVRLAGRLTAQGERVGLITNDQSRGLVDTQLARAKGVPTEEITGGCFCCKFGSLMEAADKLSAAERPTVLLAEPVGSCTDLAATVAYPLRRLYGEHYTIAPYSVAVDPARCERVLKLEPGPAFTDKVRYVYQKQLEEAEIVLVNKCDTLTAERLRRLTGELQSRYPQATVLAVSARDGTGFDEWQETLDRLPLTDATAMELDYDLYADGEALLGWANATYRVHAATPFDGNAFLAARMAEFQAWLEAESAEVAHLKMTLIPSVGNDLAVMNLTRSAAEPEAGLLLAEPVTAATWTVNVRAECDPELLKAMIDRAAVAGVTLEHAEAFRPGRPVPTHRFTQA